MNKPPLEPIALSALQHWQYCPRQCGLIHLEQAFDDNIYTLRGQAVHTRVDQAGMTSIKSIRVERALPLWNDTFGLIGKADVVEFLPDGTPYPVEYKQGNRNKAADIAACDDIQLAAQAVCLEAMTGKMVPEGALYYAKSKRRRVVPITAALRSRVESVIHAVRQMLSDGQLPAPLENEQARQRCKGCSLLDRCQPLATHTTLVRARQELFDPDA